MISHAHITIEAAERRRLGPETAALREVRDWMVSEGKMPPGFYRLQLVPRAVWSPVRIWRGFGFEPGTFHFREVVIAARALLNGKPVPLRRVWPACAWEPIGMGEYRWRLAMFRYATKHARHLPEASPYQPVDFGRLQHNVAR